MFGLGMMHLSSSYTLDTVYLASSSQQPYAIGTRIPTTDDEPKAEAIDII